MSNLRANRIVSGIPMYLVITRLLVFAAILAAINSHVQAQPLQVIGHDGLGNPICNGPRGTAPCAIIQRWLNQNPGPSVLPMPQQAPSFGMPPPTEPSIPSLGNLIPPQIDIPDFGTPINGDPQEVAIHCAQSSGTDVDAFARCAGKNVILPQHEQAVLDCAFDTTSKEDFAACAAPNLGIRLSRDQQTIANCAYQSKGDEDNFASCAGSQIVGNALTPEQKEIVGCAANADNASDFATCSASTLIGSHLSRDQNVAVECAVQSQGDPTGFATCAGTKMLSLQLNPEQQIAIECVVTTGAQPYAAGACIATALTARELEKCSANGFGGDDGCFGNNNDLLGRNGWTARTLAQVARGPNSVVRNPGQI